MLGCCGDLSVKPAPKAQLVALLGWLWTLYKGTPIRRKYIIGSGLWGSISWPFFLFFLSVSCVTIKCGLCFLCEDQMWSLCFPCVDQMWSLCFLCVDQMWSLLPLCGSNVVSLFPVCGSNVVVSLSASWLPGWPHAPAGVLSSLWWAVHHLELWAKISPSPLSCFWLWYLITAKQSDNVIVHSCPLLHEVWGPLDGHTYTW